MNSFYVTYYAPERETEKAIKDAHWGWLPKSQVQLAENSEGQTLMIVPGWLKRKVAGSSNFAFGQQVWTPVSERDFPKSTRRA